MENVGENRLGTMPVGKLLMQMSLPIVASMLVQALYNVVDSIFVARYSDAALAAVSLVFPFQNLMIALGVGTSVGVGSLLSRRLGEKNHESANRTAVNGLFLATLNWIAFALVCGLFANRFFTSYANNPAVGPEIADLAASYLRIVAVFSLGLFWSVINERLLQATGRATLSMVTQMTGAIINIILDPILIFGYFGFPEMGIDGAAIATVIGQIGCMLLGIFMNVVLNKEIRIHFKGFKPSGKTIKHIYQVGLPAIIMQSIGSVMTFGMNIILAGFSSIAVSVFGVYFKLQSFVFMPVFGINNGLVPIIAYNYGAKRPERIAKAVRLGVYVAFGVMVVGTLLFWLIPGPLLRMFDAGDEMLEIGTQALNLISLAFPMAAISIIFTGFFQGVGAGLNSAIMSVVRQLIFLLPSAWLLARFFGLGAVWYSFPFAEAAAMVMAIFLFLRTWRKKIKNLQSAG